MTYLFGTLDYSLLRTVALSNAFGISGPPKLDRKGSEVGLPYAFL